MYLFYATIMGMFIATCATAAPAPIAALTSSPPKSSMLCLLINGKSRCFSALHANGNRFWQGKETATDPYPAGTADYPSKEDVTSIYLSNNGAGGVHGQAFLSSAAQPRGQQLFIDGTTGDLKFLSVGASLPLRAISQGFQFGEVGGILIVRNQTNTGFVLEGFHCPQGDGTALFRYALNGGAPLPDCDMAYPQLGRAIDTYGAYAYV